MEPAVSVRMRRSSQTLGQIDKMYDNNLTVALSTAPSYPCVSSPLGPSMRTVGRGCQLRSTLVRSPAPMELWPQRSGRADALKLVCLEFLATLKCSIPQSPATTL